MKEKLVVGFVFVAALLLVCTKVVGQETGTATWSVTDTNGPCNIVGPPSWYCSVTVTDGDGDSSTVQIYVTVQSDGNFSYGMFSKGLLYDRPPYGDTISSISANNYTGTFTVDPNNPHYGTLSGTFSGTTDDGIPFTGQHTEVIGLGKACAGRYGCHPATRVLSASGSVTFAQ